MPDRRLTLRSLRQRETDLFVMTTYAEQLVLPVLALPRARVHFGIHELLPLAKMSL